MTPWVTQMIEPETLKCVLCDSKAFATAGHIPICKEHHEAYDEEGRKYLPFSERAIYQSILMAAGAGDRRALRDYYVRLIDKMSIDTAPDS